jgi:hypothetical protein
MDYKLICLVLLFTKPLLLNVRILLLKSYTLKLDIFLFETYLTLILAEFACSLCDRYASGFVLSMNCPIIEYFVYIIYVLEYLRKIAKILVTITSGINSRRK